MLRERFVPDRAAGIEFGNLDGALGDVEFPATGREVIEACGDHRIDHQRGDERLGDLLEPLADETYQSRGGVHQAVLTVVDAAAVGREGYSDRDPIGRDEPGAEDRSF